MLKLFIAVHQQQNFNTNANPTVNHMSHIQQQQQQQQHHQSPQLNPIVQQTQQSPVLMNSPGKAGAQQQHAQSVIINNPRQQQIIIQQQQSLSPQQQQQQQQQQHQQQQQYTPNNGQPQQMVVTNQRIMSVNNVNPTMNNVSPHPTPTSTPNPLSVTSNIYGNVVDSAADPSSVNTALNWQQNAVVGQNTYQMVNRSNVGSPLTSSVNRTASPSPALNNTLNAQQAQTPLQQQQQFRQNTPQTWVMSN